MIMGITDHYLVVFYPRSWRRRAVATAAGGLDHEDVAFAYVCGGAAGQLGDAPVRVLDPVAAQRAWLAAGQAERGNAAVPAERGDRHRLKEPDPPDAAAAAAPAAIAAGVLAYRVALQDDRVAPLQHLGIGEPGVRHLGLHHIGAVKTVTRTRPAGDRLVILICLVAERHVIHRPRPLRQDAQCSVERTRYRL